MQKEKRNALDEDDLNQSVAPSLKYGNMGCQDIKGGIQNQIDFWPKIKSSKEIIVIYKLTNWRVVKNCPNLTFKVHFLCQKSVESF